MANDSDDDNNRTPRLDRLERIITNQPDAAQLKADIVTEIGAGGPVTDPDNVLDAEGHSPKMLRDWKAMQDKLIAEEAAKGNRISVDDADALLDAFFAKIASGELDSNGDPVAGWVPRP